MTDNMQIDSEQRNVPPPEKSPYDARGQNPPPMPTMGPSQQPVGYWNPNNVPPGNPPYYPQQMPYDPRVYPPQSFIRPREGDHQHKSRLKGKEKEREANKSHKEGAQTSAQVAPPRPSAQGDIGSGESQQSSGGSFPAAGYTTGSQGSGPMPPPGAYPPQPPGTYGPPASNVPPERSDRPSHDRHREKASTRYIRTEHQYRGPPQPWPYSHPPPHSYYPPPGPYYYNYNSPPAHSSQETYYPNSQSSHARNSPVSHTSSSEPHSRSAPKSIASSEDLKKPRVVTLLIDDTRNNDSQLAEVRVPVKSTESQDGYWVDAREVSHALQASASRIDGPARLFAMRGRYKQIFLRVSAEGEETFTSANLKVGADRTLEVFVEYITPYVQHPGLSASTPDSIPQKRRHSPEIGSEEPYAHTEPPTPSSADLQSNPTPSEGERSRETSPMMVEGSFPDPSYPRSNQRNTADDIRAKTGRSSSTMSTSIPLPQRHEPNRPDSRGSRAQGSPHIPGTPQMTTPSSKPPPRPMAPPSSAASPTLHRSPPTPRQPPPKKARHGEGSGSDVEEIEPPPVTKPQISLSATTGFGSFALPSPGSGFNKSTFAAYRQGAPGFGSLSQTTGASPQGATSPDSGLPRASVSQSPADNAVGKYLKGILMKEPEWRDFQDARNKMLTVAEQVEQYRYLQDKIDEYVGQDIPVDVEGAQGTITKDQVMRAFGLLPARADECKEVLHLTSLYGPNGTVREDPEGMRLFHEPPPISTHLQLVRYLERLRAVHSQTTAQQSERS